METPSVLCDAVWKDGQPCDHVARVLSAQYAYDTNELSVGRTEYVLTESRLVIECPVCGLRRQVVCHQPEPRGATAATATELMASGGSPERRYEPR
jgi:hypothetical protein